MHNITENPAIKYLPAISRLKLLNGISKIIADEIEQANLDWQNFSYSEYVSEGVYSLSLLSSDGDGGNTLIKDCKPKPTEVLKKLPKTEKILNDLGLDFMWARLNLLSPHACLWEHKDYSELDSRERLRLHIPVTTNQDAYLILAGRKVHLHQDALWKLNPQDFVHGAVNEGGERIHIVLDCYVNDNLRILIQEQTLDENWLQELKTPTTADFNDKLINALRLYQGDRKRDAEELLLRTYYHYNHQEGGSLDLVREMYDLLGKKEEVNLWESRKNRFLKQETYEDLTAAAG
jgi:hypothetical protein